MSIETKPALDALGAILGAPPMLKLPLEGSKPVLPNECHVSYEKVRVSDRSFFFGEQEAMIAKPDQIERQRWNITAEIRAEIVAKLMEIVNGSNAAHTCRAARLLLQMDELNITAESLTSELEAEMKSQILRVLHERRGED